MFKPLKSRSSRAAGRGKTFRRLRCSGAGAFRDFIFGKAVVRYTVHGTALFVLRICDLDQSRQDIPHSPSSQKKAMSSSHRITVDLRSPRIIGATAMVFFLLASLLSWRAGEGVVTMLFLVFVALGFFLMVGSGHVAADDDAISVNGLLGRYELAWDRVRKVEDSGYGTLVLHADGAQLVLPPPMLWSGPDKQALRALIARQLRNRALTVRRSRSADYRVHRNVRVKRTSPNDPS